MDISPILTLIFSPSPNSTSDNVEHSAASSASRGKSLNPSTTENRVKSVNAPTTVAENREKPTLDDTPKTQNERLTEKQKEQLSDILKTVSTQLSFQLDEDSGRSVVIFSDKKSGEVIRQIPTQDLLDLNQNLAKHAPNSLQEDV